MENNLNNALKLLRKERGITQAEMADRLGVKLATYGTWERGTRTMSASQLLRCAEILECSTDAILGSYSAPKVQMRLKEERIRNGYTQVDVADMLGIPLRTYQNYERGINDPGTGVLSFLASIYGTTTDCLIGIDRNADTCMHGSAREYMTHRLRALRKERGLSVDAVGKALGKSGKTVSAWEVGRGQPDADMLVRICELYGATVSDFFEPAYGMQGVSLTTDESVIVGSYRMLSDDGKGLLREMADTMVKSGKYERRGAL